MDLRDIVPCERSQSQKAPLMLSQKATLALKWGRTRREVFFGGGVKEHLREMREEEKMLRVRPAPL